MKNSISLWFMLLLCAKAFGTEDDNAGSEHGDHEIHTWTYMPGEGCPMHWPKMFDTCAGKTQSPINIDTAIATHDPYLKELDIIVVQAADQMKMENNGHTVGLISEEEIHISGLTNVYKVHGPHFHWGNASSHGSEHVFDSTMKYPLEMHIVTYNSEQYNDISEAVESDDPMAIAVFGVLFTVSDKNNSALDPIIENLKFVQQPDSESILIKGLTLSNLWPTYSSHYYRYTGSLTTPMCHEVVLWTLFDEKTPISEYQLKEFRKLLNKQQKPLVNNFRPVQSLNGRIVTKSFTSSANPPYNVDNSNNIVEKDIVAGELNMATSIFSVSSALTICVFSSIISFLCY